MQHIDTLIHARWLIPVLPHNRELEHHSIAINSGRIVALLPTAKAHSRYSAKHTVDLPTHALIPGLINTHTHAAMSLFRGMADDLPLMQWLNEHIWPAEARAMSDAFVRDGTRLAIAEMLRGGTTCFNDMYFFPDQCAKVAAEVGMRAVVGLIVLDFPTVWAEHAEEYIAKGVALHDETRHQLMISTAFAPHAPYTVSDGPLERIRVLADELDLPVHIHLHETEGEVNDALKASGERPIQRLQRLGLLSPRLLAVHMTTLTDEDRATAAAHGVHVVHCPESNLKLASGFCPVQQLASAGVNVALGTDGAASNNDLDMFGEMRTAALLAKAVANNAAAVPASSALAMATINGARALGLEDEVGSLEVGKAADVVAVDLNALATQPVYSATSSLVYAASRDQVSHVWVHGQAQLERGQLLNIDARAAIAKAQEWRDNIAI